MLANRRKHKVMGRTEMLTSSTRHKKGTRYQGEFCGRTAEKTFDFIVCKKMPHNQQESAALRLNPKVVVTGYL